MTHRKLRLDLEQLGVESFLTFTPEEEAGTVHGHGQVPIDQPTSNYDTVCNTYSDSCNGTCASCVNTCWASCNGTCNSCNFTCQLSCHSVCHEPA